MKKLKQFIPTELLFNEEETKEILSFFFPNLKKSIKKIKINNDIKSFAQGLLIEAIDASYALGFVEALFTSSINPSAKMLTVMRKFAIKSAKHWFEHATAKDLRQVKIYYIVRQRLQINFKSVMLLIINGLDFRYMVYTTPTPQISHYT